MTQRANRPRVALLLGGGTSSDVLFHALECDFDIVAAISEPPPSRSRLVRRRLRRLGIKTVGGQLIFQTVAVPLLRREARARYLEILRERQLSTAPIPSHRLIAVPSINDQSVVDVLAEVRPDVVVVNGTRVIAETVLQRISAPIVNIHVGITPRFRGVHGGYWALAEQTPELCGVTVHFIDKGIDTGAIIAQARVHPTANDNFATYPLLQLAAAIPLLQTHLPRIAQGDRTTIPPPDRASKLWYHPTIGGYLRTRWLYGVK